VLHSFIKNYGILLQQIQITAGDYMDKMNKYLMPGRIMAEIIPEKMDL